MQEERAEDPPGGGLVTFDELIRQMEGAKKGLGALRAGSESTGALWRSLYSCCMIVADRAG
jgi:hypothetical protein